MQRCPQNNLVLGYVKCMVSMATHRGFENGGMPTKVLISLSFHIGPLDEWTCQIVPLIISKHATMTILG